MKKGNIFAALVVFILMSITCVSVFAADVGGVATAIEGTWDTAKTEVKTVVDNVVFPIIDLVLAVFFFVKLGTSYFEYKKHGQFEWGATRS